MKLKIYHTIIFFLLGLSVALNIYFLVDACIFTGTSGNISNGILFILCFLVLLAFIGLEIYNTIHSLKNGSNFVKVLIYEDTMLIKKGIVVTSLCLAGFIALLVYFILLRVGLELPLNNLPSPLKNLVIGLMTLCIFDSIIILIFPYFGKEDIAFKKKN